MADYIKREDVLKILSKKLMTKDVAIGEIKNLPSADVERYKGVIKILENDVKTAKSDAVKEYKEKVKAILMDKGIYPVLVKNALNEAEKEMIEREDLK